MWDKEHRELKKLRQKRDEALAKAQAVLEGKDENENLTPAERKEFDRWHRKAKKLNERMRDAPQREPVGRGAFDGPREQLGGSMSGMDRETREYVSAWMRGETRAADLTIGAKADGGALASTGLFPELQRVLNQHGGVRATRTRKFVTSHGRAFNLPALDDVANKAEQVAEGSSASSPSKLQFSDVQFGSHTFQAGPVSVTHEQLMDSELDIADIVMGSLGERIARATEDLYAGSTATSSTSINGLITLSTGAVSMAAGSSNLTLQLVRDLHFSVDPAYRQDAEWAVSDSALQALSDLEDADSRPLIEPDVREGLAGRLYGKPVRVIQNLGSIASSSQFPILFGDFRRAYGIRDVSEVRMQRLDELYAANRRVGFLAWFRTDGRALLSSTVGAANRPVRALKTT